MMDDLDLIDGITATIQRVYGDATQTALDRKAASEIWGFLTGHFMATPTFVAAMVTAAGGEILIPDRVLMDLDRDASLVMVDDWNGKRILVRSRGGIATGASGH